MSIPTRYDIRQTLSVLTRPTKVPGLLAYQCQMEDESAPTISWEGISETAPTPAGQRPRPPKERQWVLVEAGVLEEVAEWGFAGNPEHQFACWKRVSQSPFTDLDNEDYVLVRLDIDAHMVFDITGQPLPVALDTSFWVTHTNFNIARAHTHLKGHPHVADLTHHWEHLDDEDEEGGERAERLDFRWKPDAETYRRAWARCLEFNDGFPSCRFQRAVFELDLLGLREADCMRKGK
jgi:hypothetical protein